MSTHVHTENDFVPLNLKSAAERSDIESEKLDKIEEF